MSFNAIKCEEKELALCSRRGGVAKGGAGQEAPPLRPTPTASFLLNDLREAPELQTSPH